MQLIVTEDKFRIQTLPLYASSVCAWNISSPYYKNVSQAIFIRIEEISEGEAYISNDQI